MRINSLPLFNRRRRRQTTEYLSNEDYSWIWEPFKDAKDSKLAQTACLVAEIIANSSPDKIPKVPFNLDPRIVIPLCAIALQNDLNLNNINKVNIQPTFPRAYDINYFLYTIQASRRWRYLFNSLPPQLQYKLCYRLSNDRLPNKNDWRNLFKHNNYKFDTSWHFYFSLAIFLFIFLIAMIGMFIFFISNDGDIFSTIMTVFGLSPIIYAGTVIIGVIGMVRMIEIIEGITGILFLSIFLPFVLFTLYFVNYTLINLLSFGWREILLFWLTTLGITRTLSWRGKTLDYQARNPLKGILDNTINN